MIVFEIEDIDRAVFNYGSNVKKKPVICFVLNFINKIKLRIVVNYKIILKMDQ